MEEYPRFRRFGFSWVAPGRGDKQAATHRAVIAELRYLIRPPVRRLNKLQRLVP
jgi:hypothetical protein